jgi:hypothetical protein
MEKNVTKPFALSCAVLLFAWIATATAGVPKAHGQADQAHYTAGVKKQSAGDFVAALAEFEAIAESARTYDARLHIASCKRLLGRVLDAASELEAIVELAKADTSLSPSERAAIVDTASSDLVDVRASLAHLTIKRGSGAETLSITVDGVAASPNVSLDPGPHTVTASEQGKIVFHKEVSLAPGKTTEIEVVVAPPEAGTAVVPRDAPPRPVERDHDSRRTAAWLTLGGGAVFAATAVVSFVERNSTVTAYKDSCGPSGCDGSLATRVRVWEGVAFTTAGLAVLSFGASAYLFATSSRSTSVAVSFRQGASVEIGWRF